LARVLLKRRLGEQCAHDIAGNGGIVQYFA